MSLDKKQKTIFLAVVILAVLAAGGFAVVRMMQESAAPAMAGFRVLSPKECADLIGTRQNLMIVDVRNPEELGSGWIDGSVLMPTGDILSGRRLPPKDRPILLVCAVGGRSQGLGEAMAKQGWPEVYNLFGGIAEWKRQGLPLSYK